MSDNGDKKLARAHVFISGRVQGVSFRWYTQQQAQELGLTGWVRNLWDGRVEAIFEGDEESVKRAVAWCHQGPPSARVDDIKISYETPGDEFRGFRVTH